jgi:hypothetical protein
MRRLLAIFAMLAVVCSTSQAAGMERALPKRQIQPASAAQAKPSDRIKSNRELNARRTISAASGFRAEDLIPDICKGCSC